MNSWIHIGPAGTGGDSLKGIEAIHKAGLDAVEIEFTYGVKMSNDLAKKVGELGKKLNMRLSIHAPYYINLSSDDRKKVEASKKRILESCERGHHMGASCVVFHAGYYGKMEKEECYQLIKKEILEIMDEIKKRGWKIELAPETTGKRSQFGSLDELLRLRKETGCSLCIDFAHLKARDQKIDYDDVFEKLKKTGLKRIHAHFSGIEYSEKGEKRHVLTPERELKELLIYILKSKIDTTIINESPDPLGDSIKAKKILERI